MVAKKLFIAISILMSGCTLFNRDVVMQSVDFNESLARATNQVYLTNILRAMDHEPMLLTSLTTVRGNLKFSATTGDIAIPFGGGSTDEFGVAPKITAEVNPSFDMALLDGAKFYRGFLHPVNGKIINYYLRQGWPDSLILTLFVREIEIPQVLFEVWLIDDLMQTPSAVGEWAGNGGAAKCRYEPSKEVYRCIGDPMDEDMWRGYEMVLENLKLVSEEGSEPCVAPPIEATKISIKDVTELYGEDLRIREGEAPGTYCVFKPKSPVKFKWKPKEWEAWKQDPVLLRELADSTLWREYVKRGGSRDTQMTIFLDHSLGTTQTNIASTNIDDDLEKLIEDLENSELAGEFTTLSREDSPDEKGRIFIRSPEAVLYFLGEVVRRQINVVDPVTGGEKKELDSYERKKEILISTARECQEEPLFVLEPIIAGGHPDSERGKANRTSTASDYSITVDYKNLKYGVPHTKLTADGCLEGGGRTMHALTLINQLVGLFREKDELSVTPSVLSIN